MFLPLLLLLSQSLVAASPAAPNPERAPGVVVERVVEFGPLVRRLTVFTNRVAVVSIRERERRVILRQLTLGENEYAAYVVAIARCLEQIPEGGASPAVVEDRGHGVISTTVGSGPPRRIEYWNLAALDLATGRLVAVLDDIGQRVVTSAPGEEALRGWEPEVGDWVELATGERARVVEVRDGGVIVLDLERSPLLEEIAPEHRAQRIRRVVEAPR